MKNTMMTIAEAAAEIEAGKVLLLAGSESALRHLPPGSWIGGTSVYFLTAQGGRCDEENVFVTEFAAARDFRIRHYDPDRLASLCEERFEHGVSTILIPAFSRAHEAFAIEGAGYPGLFSQPLMGWITGTHLDEIGRTTPKIVDGRSGAVHDEGAMLLHVALPLGRRAELDIINLFEPDLSADRIVFEETGFSAATAHVNGEAVDFAEYLSGIGHDLKLPLVADYAGAMINVSLRGISPERGLVQFYAPVIAGVEYRVAKSIGDYASVLGAQIGSAGGEQLSCNCILNYLYGELEGKRTGNFTGPATFGEIAYILLNQTLVHLKLEAEKAAKVA
ncbi:DUF6976 family protein [Mangrovicoccus algicola]|uniref:Uncharacterized protein n=1 Tax=Mangrovicoccus algicola TaxID=2771008 RepID=A0A8J6YX01_9RHOB|nr:hypothetical protein [Mangrovicoccus algicola]MBE3637819.1 hypothetical protein [Mangrovicoccus algicola]